MKTEWINTKSCQFLKLSASVLTVLMALIPLGVPAAATAQNTAQLSGSPQQTQRPEGSWLYTVTIPGSAFQGIETYSTGGGYTEADQLSFNPLAVASAGHGAWQMTGQRTFNLTYLNLTFDAFSSGNPTGTLKVRQTTRIDKSGNSYTGSGERTDLSAMKMQLNPGQPLINIEGESRLLVQRDRRRGAPWPTRSY